MNRLIFLFSAENPLTSEIQRTVNHKQFTIEVISHPAQFGEVAGTMRPGEPVDGGQLSNVTRMLTERQPALLIFDLDSAEIAATKWIAVFKSSPATRRLPILAYSSDAALLESAESAGAEKGVLREKIMAKSADYITNLAKQTNTSAIDNWCAQPLPDAAHSSIELFNSGQFYAAHHALEELWMNDKGAARDFYRAILQVAVAYYQIERGNYRGAVKMFLRVRQWLNPLPDVCRGVDLARLRDDTEASFARVSELGAERISEFDKSLVRPIKLA